MKVNLRITLHLATVAPTAQNVPGFAIGTLIGRTHPNKHAFWFLPSFNSTCVFEFKHADLPFKSFFPLPFLD
jgi:hypothetical protein